MIDTNVIEVHKAKDIAFMSGPKDRCDANFRLACFKRIMKEYGYEIKQPKGGSSHYSFVKPGCSRIVIPRHKPIKKVYVKMIKKVIEEEMNEDESRTQLLHESVVSYGNC